MDIDKINELYYTNRKLLQEQSEEDERVFYSSVPLELEHRNKPKEYDALGHNDMSNLVSVSYKIYYDFIKRGIRSISVYDVKVEPFTIYENVYDLNYNTEAMPIDVDFRGEDLSPEVHEMRMPFVPDSFRLVVDGITPNADESYLVF